MYPFQLNDLQVNIFKQVAVAPVRLTNLALNQGLRNMPTGMEHQVLRISRDVAKVHRFRFHSQTVTIRDEIGDDVVTRGPYNNHIAT